MRLREGGVGVWGGREGALDKEDDYSSRYVVVSTNFLSSIENE